MQILLCCIFQHLRIDIQLKYFSKHYYPHISSSIERFLLVKYWLDNKKKTVEKNALLWLKRIYLAYIISVQKASKPDCHTEQTWALLFNYLAFIWKSQNLLLDGSLHSGAMVMGWASEKRERCRLVAATNSWIRDQSFKNFRPDLTCFFASIREKRRIVFIKRE